MFKSIILGFIQGITEFLPISSSAHLILIPYLIGWTESSMAFDIALHFGTLLAILLVFFKDWLNLLIGVFKRVFNGRETNDYRLFWVLVIATLPGALLGFLLNDIVECFFRTKIWLIAIALGIMGILIYLGDRWATKNHKFEIEFEYISFKQAFIIGLSQAFAIIPGFSRSGTTIFMSRILGLSKKSATKFTFLLSVPIIFGATIFEVGNLEFNSYSLVGIFTSFVVGLLSIKFLLNYIKKHDFSVFAIYRVLFSVVILIKYFCF